MGWDPKSSIEYLEIFGKSEKDAPIEHTWPTEQDLENFPTGTRIQLCKINYKLVSDEDAVGAIQFQFTNDEASPMFATPNGANHLHEKEVDTTRRIAKVGMHIV